MKEGVSCAMNPRRGCPQGVGHPAGRDPHGDVASLRMQPQPGPRHLPASRRSTGATWLGAGSHAGVTDRRPMHGCEMISELARRTTRHLAAVTRFGVPPHCRHWRTRAGHRRARQRVGAPQPDRRRAPDSNSPRRPVPLGRVRDTHRPDRHRTQGSRRTPARRRESGPD
jgi:hypothetical protein